MMSQTSVPDWSCLTRRTGTYIGQPDWRDDCRPVQPLSHPLLVRLLDAEQPFFRVLTRLIIDSFVIYLAEQYAVVVAVRITFQRTKPGSAGSFGYDVRLVAYNRLAVMDCAVDNKLPLADGTTLSRSPHSTLRSRSLTATILCSLLSPCRRSSRHRDSCQGCTARGPHRGHRHSLQSTSKVALAVSLRYTSPQAKSSNSRAADGGFGQTGLRDGYRDTRPQQGRLIGNGIQLCLRTVEQTGSAGLLTVALTAHEVPQKGVNVATPAARLLGLPADDVEVVDACPRGVLRGELAVVQSDDQIVAVNPQRHDIGHLSRAVVVDHDVPVRQRRDVLNDAGLYRGSVSRRSL